MSKLQVHTASSSMVQPFAGYRQGVEVPPNAGWLYIAGQVGVMSDGTIDRGWIVGESGSSLCVRGWYAAAKEAVMLRRRFFFRAGAVVWIAGAIGHFTLIDVLTLHAHTPVAEFIPHADLLGTMEKTTLAFGILGSTTVFLATAGFSIWVPLSLTFLGIAYLLLSQQEGVTLRRFTGLGVVVSATFFATAATCFIIPATIGAVAATAFFALSWMRNES
jgi:hypothetical protein